ncbi:MAG: Glucokinase [Bacteroidota bacterium]|jgi:glucokinase
MYFDDFPKSHMSSIPAVAAVDIGGTNTVFALVGRDGSILRKSSVPTRSAATPEEYVGLIAGELQKLSDGNRISGVGVGAPNGNYFNGTIEFAPNLPWRGVIRLAELFTERLSAPAFVTNDANAAALGEMYFGSARNIRDFIFVTLGTGLGSGIVVNGDLVYGHDGFAGELGHTILLQHGRPCGCGRRGCLEQYCSATGLVKTYREILRSGDLELPEGLDYETITSRFVFERALAGDETAFSAFNYTGELLGLALANSVAYTSPEAIFLFGGLANAGELLFTPTQLSFEKNLLSIYKGKVRIMPSGLPENDAPLLGAASLAWNELEKK